MREERAHEAQAKSLAKMLQEQRHAHWTWKVRITTGKDKNSKSRAITSITRRYLEYR
jgi:hypothetical protein